MFTEVHFTGLILTMAQMMEMSLIVEENVVGIGENEVYQNFLHFKQCFEKLSFYESL